MTQNVLQVASDDQLAEDKTEPALAPGARALLDHLNSALPISTEGGFPAAGDTLVAARQVAAPRMPSFGLAVARQADQIQHLIEQFDRLDRDTQVTELRGIVRDLCGVLNDVALRVKHDSSDVATKIGFLTGAMTIISSAPGPDAPHDSAALLDSAKAAAERLASLERLSKDVGAAILALQNNTSLGQSTVRDLSDNLAKLNAHAESDRNEIAKLGQTIEAERNEIAQLQHRMAAADQTLAQELTTSSERASMLRDDLGRVQERLDTVETSAAAQAGFLEKIEVLSRRLDELEQNNAAEINGWRIENSERFAALMSRVESLEKQHQTLSRDKEQTATRLQETEQALATMTQSQKALSAWRDRITHVLLASPDLPAG